MSRTVRKHFERKSQRNAKANAFKRNRTRSGLCSCDVCGWTEPPVVAEARGSGVTLLHCHHVIPAACGGTNEDENLVLLCPNHHALAHRCCRVTNGTGAWQYHGPTTSEGLIGLLRDLEDRPEHAREVLASIEAEARQIATAFLHQPRARGRGPNVRIHGL